MQADRRPLSDNEAAQLAEQRWLNEEARSRRHFAIAALGVAAGLVATCVAASFGQLALARACCIIVLSGMARVIYLIIGRKRSFIAVKMDGGMTRDEALSEFNSRFGG
jgi:hypothetical protein